MSEILSIYDAHHPQWQSAARIACPNANMLKAWRARQVRIDERGRVFAPAFPARTARRKPRKRT